jgi:small conductance mechanosensitive channel
MLKDILTKISNLASSYSEQAIKAVAILLIGFWIARRVAKLVQKILGKTHLDATYIPFAGNVTKIGLYFLVTLAALNNLGVEMTSVLALLGTAGLAVALALKDSLNNVAAGISLLVLRPFRVGDYVELGSTGGSVVEINFFHTFLNTPDNRRIAIPNAKVLAEAIVNFSHNSTRRLDMVFSISYDSDLKKARQIFEELIAADERVLSEPEPVIAVGALADNSVDFFVRPWVNTENVWPVIFSFTEQVKLTFDEAGIVIPYPQRDVHLFHQNPQQIQNLSPNSSPEKVVEEKVV